MQPRQMRETSRPVRPSFVYSIVTCANSFVRVLLPYSEPFFLVDKVKQRLFGGKAPAVLYQHRLPFLAIGSAVNRDMRLRFGRAAGDLVAPSRRRLRAAPAPFPRGICSRS